MHDQFLLSWLVSHLQISLVWSFSVPHCHMGLIVVLLLLYYGWYMCSFCTIPLVAAATAAACLPPQPKLRLPLALWTSATQYSNSSICSGKIPNFIALWVWYLMEIHFISPIWVVVYSLRLALFPSCSHQQQVAAQECLYYENVVGSLSIVDNYS